MPVDVSILPPFVAAAVFLAISPGPDLVLIVTYSTAKGARAGLWLAAGIFIAGLVQTMLVAVGLGKLMSAAPGVAVAVRMVGAVYLGAIGVRLLHQWFVGRNTPTEDDPEDDPEALPSRRLVARGLGNNLLNPKALIFFSVFLPQFTTDARSIPVQIVVLGVLLSTVAFLVNAGVACSVGRIAGAIGQGVRRSGRHVEGVLGGLFVGLAVRLAVSK